MDSATVRKNRYAKASVLALSLAATDFKGRQRPSGRNEKLSAAAGSQVLSTQQNLALATSAALAAPAAVAFPVCCQLAHLTSLALNKPVLSMLWLAKSDP